MSRRGFANLLISLGLMALIVVLGELFLRTPADRASDRRRLDRLVRTVRRRFGF